MAFLNLLGAFFSWILNLQEHLQNLIDQYGAWTYGILFFIIFCETGLVILPFLPGDSLLFTAGAFAATGAFSIHLLLVLLAAAAIIGDTINYWIGAHLSRSVFTEDSRFFKKQYLEKTEAFYEKHGGKTIVLARFIPIIRTFAPCVAGMSNMNYTRFVVYNVLGGVLWVALFLYGGFLFGNIPLVQDNFSLVILGIIAISLIPIISNMVSIRREKKKAAAESTEHRQH